MNFIFKHYNIKTTETFVIGKMHLAEENLIYKTSIKSQINLFAPF